MRSPAHPAPKSVAGGVSSWLRDEWLTVDLIWAGVFRIGLGLALLWDLGRRASELSRLHSNAGVLPNHYVLFDPPKPGLVSLLHPFSSPGEVAVAFAAIALAYLALTVGVATRIAQLVSAVCIVSLTARTPLVAEPASAALALLSLWTLVLPLGRRLSIDSLRSSLRAVREKTGVDLRRRPASTVAPTQLASWSVIALALHWAALYAATGAALARDDSALALAPRLARAPWDFLANVPAARIDDIERAVTVICFLVAVLLLTPVLRRWRLRVGLVLATVISAIVASTSPAGPLPVVVLLPFVLLSTKADRRAIAARLRGRVRVVVYDADCGVCLLVARVLVRLDGFRRLRFVGNDETSEIPEAVDRKLLDRTIVVVDRDRVYGEGRAVAAIVAALPGGTIPGALLRLPGLSAMLDRGYRAVATRRLEISAWLGLGACGVGHRPSDLRLKPALASPWQSAAIDASPRERALARATAVGRELAALAIAATLFVGARATFQRLEASGPFGALARALAPVDLTDVFGGALPARGRLVVDGRTATGEPFDPLSGARPALAPEVAPPYGDLFARYASELRRPERASYRQFLVTHLLALHERQGGPALSSLEVWWVWAADRALPAEKLASHGRGAGR